MTPTHFTIERDGPFVLAVFHANVDLVDTFYNAEGVATEERVNRVVVSERLSVGCLHNKLRNLYSTVTNSKDKERIAAVRKEAKIYETAIQVLKSL